MIVYQTDDDGFFVGQNQADPDPMVPGTFLLPRGCTKKAPPATGAGQVARLNGADWVVVPDIAGTKYWLQDGQEQVVAGRGVGLPVGALLSKPPKPLSEAKAEKITSLERLRIATIAKLPPVTVAGKQYPATPEYREIITGSARRKAAGKAKPSKIRGVDGIEVSLTDALIDQIDDAITAAVQTQWDNYWVKFDAVKAATSVEQVNLVEW